MKFDLQDGLLVVGVASLEFGVWKWSVPAAFVLFGILCLTFALLSGRAQAKEVKENNGAAHK